MIKELKSLIDEHGAAKVCVWVGLKDTRTLNTWISRKAIPFHKLDDVQKVVKTKGKK